MPRSRGLERPLRLNEAQHLATVAQLLAGNVEKDLEPLKTKVQLSCVHGHTYNFFSYTSQELKSSSGRSGTSRAETYARNAGLAGNRHESCRRAAEANA